LAVPFDLDALELEGVPVPVLDGVYTALASGSADFCVSRSGTLLYASGDSQEALNRMVWLDRNGRTEPLLDTPRPYIYAQPSPDGRSLAVWIEEANGSIWTHDLARGTSTRLISGYDNHWPVWTPDSRRITFRSDRDGPANLYWQATGGGRGAERLTTSEYEQIPWSWTPDGARLVFGENRLDTAWDLWIFSIEGDRAPEVLLQTPFDEREASLSADGRWIAYSSNESGRFEVYLQPFPSLEEKSQVSTNGGSLPRWNPRGGELFYVEGDKLMAVSVDTRNGLALGNPRPLAEGVQGMGMFYGYGVDSSGQRFATLAAIEEEPSPRRIHLVQNWFQELEELVPTEN